MRPHRRTTLAATLVGVAVLLPTAAWYVSGTRDAGRRASVLEETTRVAVRADVERESARLGVRLEALRSQESRRPFFHYQTLYHDPRGAAQGLSVTPSPLVSGAADPLVLAHFQIDENGLVTLPTVSERFPELSSDGDFAAFCSHLTELQHAVVVDDDADPGGAADEEQVLTLTTSEWEQIIEAESVYASITGKEQSSALLPRDDVGRVVIRVRPLHWHTLVSGSGPSLAALREVHTPTGILLQGFTIAPEAVVQWLGAGPYSLDFSPASSATSDTVAALVTDTGWVLQADAGEALATAAAQGHAVIAQFRRTFALTAAAVFLAAAAVLLILFQTERLARQRARFAAAAAHELKTPLSGLLLHSEMLAQNMGEPKHYTRYAAIVAAEADRLGRVVTNMLDLARLERGALVADPRRGDLGAAVARCVERQRPRLEEAGVALDVTIEPGLPDGLFDADALCQILDNLLDNAEKHTRSEKDRRIAVRVEGGERRLRIAVEDNGPGIPRHQRRALFRPFDRPPEADGKSGLGLGLALARSLARAQDGDLEVNYTQIVQMNIRVTLPRAEFSVLNS